MHFLVGVITHDCDYDTMLEPYGSDNEDWFEFCEEGPLSALVDRYNLYVKDNDLCEQTYSLNDYAEEEGYSIKGGYYGYDMNPNAEWDWYTLGGRWRAVNVCRRIDNGEDVNASDASYYKIHELKMTSKPYAFITPNQEWTETDSMTIDEWNNICQQYPDCCISFVDCHM